MEIKQTIHQSTNPPMYQSTSIQDWLVTHLAEELGLTPDEIDVRQPFESFGLSSREAVLLSGELEEWLGRRLQPTLLWEYPTIEALARHLAGAEPTAKAESRAEPETRNLEPETPIAIIGIGCRLPGAAGPAAFWQLLRAGVDAISETPPDRWDNDAFYDPDPLAPGKLITRWGGFLEGVDEFDAAFFGISPREAERMDPQQRLLLEVAWEALEDAGQPPDRLAGSLTGVFVGISSNDYARLQFAAPEFIDAYAGTGNAHSIAANRLSYFLDLQGPSVAVDTACSASLVAVHLACQSLRAGECDLALAGGVNVMLTPDITINFTKAGVMAADGRCKAFDARADGYVRGEGAGMVVLKPLPQALADGDPIYAVILGGAVNHDGRSNGLMAPNPQAQEAVLREAYRRAGVSPGRVQYVEAHGTGTFLGDPIEAQALGAVMATDRPPGSFCALGSVKTNIGHLEAAAGVAGLIKVALALKHREIPPSLHFQEPNPLIPFAELPLRVQQTLAPWPESVGAGLRPAQGPALAGVSSFGFGGTNAHLVLQEAPPSPIHTSLPPQGIARSSLPLGGIEGGPSSLAPRAHLLPLSARSPEALSALARVYREFLAREDDGDSLPDICYTASVRRSHHDYRLAVVGHSKAGLVQALEGFLRGEAAPGIAVGRKVAGQPPRLVFVFPGQGSQWPGMGRQLLEQEPLFQEALERCARALEPHVDWALLEMLTADMASSRLEEIDVVQPTLFAIQVALVALWRAWGVEPQAVVGHSMGEVAAAHVAGALSLEDAARVICLRSRLMKRSSGQGAMVAVGLTLEEARQTLQGYEDRVSIAVSNSPSSTVLSGDPAALQEIADALHRRNLFCRFVKVDVAAHSPQMDPLRSELVQGLEGLMPQTVAVPFISSVTGAPCEGTSLDARYWGRNLREPVLFAQAVHELLRQGYDTFLELSPHPILLSAIQQTLLAHDSQGTVLGSLRRREAADDAAPTERAALLTTLGSLYSRGYPVDWPRLYPHGGRHVALPTYPWQHRRYWLELPSPLHSPALLLSRPDEHPLLGQHLDLADVQGRHIWTGQLSRQALRYLEEHRVRGAVLLPASAILEMALAAAAQAPLPLGGAGGGLPRPLKAVEFQRPLFLPEEQPRQVQVILSPAPDGKASFQIFSRPATAAAGEPWTCHVTGRFSTSQSAPAGLPSPAERRWTRPSTASYHDLLRLGDWETGKSLGREAVAEIQARCTEAFPGATLYRELEKRQVHYGPAFQHIEQVWRREGEALARVHLADGPAHDERYQVHPTLLDTCFQTLAAALPAEAVGEGDIYMPTRIERVTLHGRPQGPLWSHAQLRPVTRPQAEAIEGDVWLFDDSGQLVAEMQGVRFQPLALGVRPAAAEVSEWLYELQWQPRRREATAEEQGRKGAEEQGSKGAEEQRSRGAGELGSAGATPHLRTSAPLLRSWLIFADAGGVGEALAARLQAQDERTVLVHAGERFEQVASRRFQLHPARPEEMAQLFQAALGDNGSALRGVVHLWSLDVPPTEELTAASLQAAQTLICGSVLHLVQELDRANVPSPVSRPNVPRLWLVTQGAQAVGEEPVPLAVAQASLWGLGRTIAQEHCALWGGLIDLEPGETAEAAAARLWEEIWQPDGEDQMAFRGGQRFVARLVRRPEPDRPPAPLPWRADGTYLITGGLGDLGLAVARWMAEQGARRLILMGRTPLPPRARWSEVADDSRQARRIAAVRELEALGVSVHLASVDVADEAQLAEFLSTFRSEGWPPIRGVVHAAGVIEDRTLQELDLAALHAVLRPKVLGGWLLHRLLADAPLDFFVLFSSAASLLSQPGQGNYAAANAFLDGLAQHRRACGLPALGINWGPWQDLGFAATPGGQRIVRFLTHLGMASIPPQQGLEVLGLLLGQQATQVLVLPVDWPRYREQAADMTGSPLLAVLRREQASRGAEAPGSASAPARLPTSAQELVTYLQQRVARVLRMEEQAVPADRNVMELGLDSIMVMELIRQLEQDLKLRLYPREIFERPSISALAEYLASEVGAGLRPAPTPAPTADLLAKLRLRRRPGPRRQPTQRNPGVAFLLSAPRSGSTLLRVMLDGHPALFCPPELHLLPFDTMQEREAGLAATYLGEGLQRAFMELMGLDAEGSKAFVDELTAQDLPIQQVYGRLQALANGRLLVDKSPSYGADMETLQQAEALFEGARYIFLVRHPYAVIDSCVRIRLERLFGVSDVDPYEFAEQVWAAINGNVLDFLRRVEPERQLLVRYEELVSTPAAVAQRLCGFLGIPFDEAVLKPYEGQRMTNGVHGISLGVGDPNFLQHDGIEAALGDVWKTIVLPKPLGGFARRVAAELQYELPRESSVTGERRPPAITRLSRQRQRVSISERGELTIQ